MLYTCSLILQTFSQMLQKCEIATSLKRNNCLQRCQASLFAHCSVLFCLFFCCMLSEIIFSQFVTDVCLHIGSFWESLFAYFADFASFLRRLFSTLLLGSNLEGLAAGGRGPWKMQSLQTGDVVSSRPATPAGVQRILRATPSVAGPYTSTGDLWTATQGLE